MISISIKYILATLILIGCACHCTAQIGSSPQTLDDLFVPRQEVTNKEFDVTIFKPENFNLIDLQPDIPSLRIPLFYKGSQCIHTVKHVVESENKDCLILYPEVEFHVHNSLITAEEEIRAYAHDLEMDITGMIHHITDSDTLALSNADEIMIYEITLPEPYIENFTYSTVIIFQKYAHPAITLRIVMNGEGLKKRDIYLEKALQSVKYGNTISYYGRQFSEWDINRNKVFRSTYKNMRDAGYYLPGEEPTSN